MTKNTVYTRTQLILLVALRVAIGWHLMYEGIVKLLQPGWSSYAYLMDSKGWFSEFFMNMAANPALLNVIDFLNMWGLTVIGFAMIAGIFTNLAKAGALLLLLFYYVAHPPLMMADYIFPGEGSYLWVNKNLIELLAVAVLFAFPTGHIIGIDRLLKNLRKK
ncbi:MAG: DoxX family membrane protein [Bacteroidales bacterium]